MSCVVGGCKSRMGRGNQNITFHKFPRDKVLQKIWKAAVCREVNWTPKPHHRVCSKHFTEERFYSDDKWRRLKEKSVPTLNLQTQLVDMANPTTSSSTNPASVSSKITPLDNIIRQSVNPNNQQSDLYVTVYTGTQCVKCAEHVSRIDQLERRIMKLEKLAKRRLLRIDSLRQHNRRSEIKSSANFVYVTNLLEKQ